MTEQPSGGGRAEELFGLGRRKFIAVGSGVGAALLAGCTSDDPGDESSTGGGSDDGDGDPANFRLLVSDAPADIDDFERLDVTFDSARIFDGGGEDTDEEGPEDEEGTAEDDQGDAEDDQGDAEDDDAGESTDAEGDASTDDDGDGPATETEDGDEGADGGEEEAADETEDGGSDPDDGDDADAGDADEDRDNRGFYVLDLDDPTVDLTEVVGERAVAIFDGELSEGRYRKIELYVADIEGIVDGEAVEVTVPSGKLQLTRPFELRAGEDLDFVFDINVVKRGNQDSYNLRPVISKSGVRGEDVDVEVVGDESGGAGAAREDGEEAGDEESSEEEAGETGGSTETESEPDADGEDEDDDAGTDGDGDAASGADGGGNETNATADD